MQTQVLEIDGVRYSIEYMIDDEDVLTCFLPDGSTRSTSLRGGWHIETAIKTHLMATLKSKKKASAL